MGLPDVPARRAVDYGKLQSSGPPSLSRIVSLASAVKAYAVELGFLACGITSLEPNAHGATLDSWLARGYAGTMRYLHRQAAKRKEPARIVAGAKSAVIVLDNYYYPDPDSTGPQISKYARGSDYHRESGERMELLAEFLRQNGATIHRPFIDAGPVPERELARRAGLGWIGKNTMLIRPRSGSFFFIGSVFTDLQLPADPPADTDHCGSCTRCLDACPTNAFVAPRILDATRCISYQTIEQRGPISEALVDKMEGWAFGCDICNDVCPWNERFAETSRVPGFAARKWIGTADEGFFDRMTEQEFADAFSDTPLARPGLAGMRRNWRAAWRSRPDVLNPNSSNS
ncbi:MAG: tRNA epoxyqueuosine(34) reductase QueG [Gemmatimonadota bacterium]